MKFIILLLIVIQLHSSEYLDELLELKKDQRELLWKIFLMAEKEAPHLKYVLPAIAWKESSFGIKTRSLCGNDLGVFQININTFANRYKSAILEYNIATPELKRILRSNFHLNFLAAKIELDYWRTRFKSEQKIFQSYNGGTSNSHNSIEYGKDLVLRTKAIKQYIFLHQ